LMVNEDVTRTGITVQHPESVFTFDQNHFQCIDS